MTPLGWAGAALAGLMTLAQLGALRGAWRARGGADRGSAAGMVAAWHLLLGVALAEAAWAPALWAEPAWLPAAGGALFAAGFLLRIVAVSQLDRHFSPLVALHDDHALVTTGLYARLRHPAYLGSLAWAIALGLLLGSAAALALVPLVYGPALAWRLRVEEAALAARFGPAWDAYCAAVPALLPCGRRSVNPM